MEAILAVPKKKTSVSKRNMRRASNSKVKSPNWVSCSQCGDPVLKHHVCNSCGFYRNREVIEPVDA